MSDDLSKRHIADIVKELDDVIGSGPWNETNFLRMIGQKLRTIRDDFVTATSASATMSVAEENVYTLNRVAQQQDLQEVFVALYNTDGSSIHSWEVLLANLQQYMVSRPIYENEAQLISMQKTKTNRANEAYISVYVNKQDIVIVSPDKTPVDKLGNFLLTLKENALDLTRIVRFEHASGRYRYIKGRLVLDVLEE